MVGWLGFGGFDSIPAFSGSAMIMPA